MKNGITTFQPDQPSLTINNSGDNIGIHTGPGGSSNAGMNGQETHSESDHSAGIGQVTGDQAVSQSHDVTTPYEGGSTRDGTALSALTGRRS